MKRLTIIALIVTAVWLLTFAIVLFFHVSDVFAMTLNEWGDFLAGTFAPLALFWLVIGYFQHGEELRLNTRALETQQEELRRQVQETARLADTAREEVRFFQERERREARPDLVPTGGWGRCPEGTYVELANRGEEVRQIYVYSDGPQKLTFSPDKIVEKDRKGLLTLHHKKNESPSFPIQFRIICSDLIGYNHTMEFSLNKHYEITKLTHKWEDLAERYEA